MRWPRAVMKLTLAWLAPAEVQDGQILLVLDGGEELIQAVAGAGFGAAPWKPRFLRLGSEAKVKTVRFSTGLSAKLHSFPERCRSD